MHAHAVMLTLAALGLQHASSGADLPQEASPQICVVVKTYAAHAHSLPVTLSGIFSDRDTRQHMRAIVVETDASAPFPNLPTLVDHLNVLIGFTGIIVSPRTSENVRGAFPRLKMNDYGYLASDATLEDLLFAWAAARWPAEDGCEVSHSGLQTECAGSGSVSRSMDHVIAPLPYAADAGLACDALLVTNGDNVYAASMWSEVRARAVGNTRCSQLCLPPPQLLQALSSWRPPAPPAQLAVDAAGAPDPGPPQAPVRPGGAHLVATHWATHYEQPSHSRSYLQARREEKRGGGRRGEEGGGGLFSYDRLFFLCRLWAKRLTVGR